MKKIAPIAGVLLLSMAIIPSIFYWYRKGQIADQYVSRTSTAVFSIAVDDLLLNQMPRLFSGNKDKSDDSAGAARWLKDLIFEAGIHIPARIFLFSTAEHDHAWYGILPMKNYDDGFSFFERHYPEKINFADKNKGTLHVPINPYVHLLFDRDHLVYRIGLDPNRDQQDLQELLSQPGSWTQISSFAGFEEPLSKQHISYFQTDGKLRLGARFVGEEIQMTGQWELSQDLNPHLFIRDIDTTRQTLTFWNLLPFTEIPPLGQLLNRVLALQVETLAHPYFDLQIKDAHVRQLDSSITYTYDDDFNAVEQLQVQEKSVPDIGYTLAYDASQESPLPENLFYKFHKKRMDGFLMSSTSAELPNELKRVQTTHPLYFFADFEKWPDAWSGAPFDYLKKKKIKAELAATLLHQNKLTIQGWIHY